MESPKTQRGRTTRRDARPAALPDVDDAHGGVVGALRCLAVETARSFRAQCQFICQVDQTRIDSWSALTLCRVAEAWLRETSGRARLRTILMCLSERSGAIELTIDDSARRAKGRIADGRDMATIAGLVRDCGGNAVASRTLGGGLRLICRVPCGARADVINSDAA